MDGGEGDTTSGPPSKRRREDNESEDLYQNDCEHAICKDQLIREMEKKKPKISRLKELMDATYKQWIEYSAPSETAKEHFISQDGTYYD